MIILLAICALLGADRAAPPDCLSCHQLPWSHPLGQYGGEGLRPLDRLRPQIVLSEGSVTCTTCHDGASTQKDKLAIYPVKNLCLACHDYGTSPADYAAFPAEVQP